ncbi:MAG: hypothetical protein JWO49_1159 [Arthrobacter sp.]|nr:hypothetical protein [Arthrobacter sp.]
MPAPSDEHAPVLRDMSDELLKAFPTASVFTWHVLDDDGFRALNPPRAYLPCGRHGK